MKLLRPSTSNKQNLIRKDSNTKDNNFDSLKLQLKLAISEINHLKEQNRRLLIKLQNKEKEIINIGQLKEENDFLKEQEENTRQQLLNYEEINKKLREQLEKVEQQNKLLKNQNKRTNTSRDRQTRIQTRQSYEQDQPFSNRSNHYSFRADSIISDRQKTNHTSTPKSKIRINIQEFIPDNIPERRRVFF